MVQKLTTRVMVKVPADAASGKGKWVRGAKKRENDIEKKMSIALEKISGKSS